MSTKNILKNMNEKTVLIVDDDALTLNVLEKNLLSAGYKVVKAMNGKEALFIADDFLPDVIILDIVMPVMGGTETIQYLGGNPRTRNIPVVLLPSLISEKDKIKEFNNGRYFQAKPIDKDKLFHKISNYIEKGH